MEEPVSNGTSDPVTNGQSQPAMSSNMDSNMGPVAVAIPPIPAQQDTGISADEIALYDRQIRLWGVQSQQKIRSSSILLITMKALSNEIAKNLVLAGIGSLTILDHNLVTPQDLGAQFFVSEADVGSNRAEAAAPQIRKLNPRVSVIVDTEDITTKRPSYFQAFDIIIATDLHPETLNIINTATRVIHKPFYAAGTHGLYGFIFSDLIQHDFVIEREKTARPTLLQPETRTRTVVATQTKRENGKTIELVTKRELYSTWFLASDAAALPPAFLASRRRLRAVTPVLSCLRALWDFQQLRGGGGGIGGGIGGVGGSSSSGNGQGGSGAGAGLPGHNRPDLELFTTLAHQKHTALGLPTETLRAELLRSFLQNVGSELAAVAAVLGGQLAQDVINVLGQRQQPIQNLVLFDGDRMEAPVYALHPEGALGEQLLPFSVGAGMAVDGGNGVLLNGGGGGMMDGAGAGAAGGLGSGMAGVPQMPADGQMPGAVPGSIEA